MRFVFQSSCPLVSLPGQECVDFTPCDGSCALSYIRNKRGYVGICFTDFHAEALRKFLVASVLKAFGTADDPLFVPAYAAGLKSDAPGSEPKKKKKAQKKKEKQGKKEKKAVGKKEKKAGKAKNHNKQDLVPSPERRVPIVGIDALHRLSMSGLAAGMCFAQSRSTFRARCILRCWRSSLA